MKPEIKEKWLEALRSGRYKQGNSYLKNYKNEFCCLGVLCDLVDPSGWEMEENENPLFFLFDNSASYLSNDFISKIGKFSIEMMYELAKMNDTGKSFKKIADYIEKEIPCQD